MTQTRRFVLNTKVGLQNFLKIEETQADDLIISLRGKRHSVPVGSQEAASTNVDGMLATTSSITVHPNLQSTIGSISINYKDNVNGNEERKVAGVFGVKTDQKLFPILASIGRNINMPSLTIDCDKYKEDKFIELWPGTGIDLNRDSLAYSVLIATPQVRFIFPEDFPRNIIPMTFKHFQVLFLYWLFNRPTRFRGTTCTFSTPDRYVNGFEFHEALNFTNDVTLAHSSVYETLPDFP